MRQSILIVDDEKSVRMALRMTLEEKYHVLAANNGSESLKMFTMECPGMLLLDIGLPDMNGIDVLRRVKKRDPDVVVIMITALEEAKTIVEAVKLGAYDYLVKPIDAQELFLTIQNAFENRQLKNQIRAIQKTSIDRFKLDLIGRNTKIKSVLKIASKVSRSVDTPVLIVGESGTGKGMLAKAIHYSVGENPGPFVTVNCGAIPKDLVESELFGYERGAYTGAKTEGKKGRFEESEDGTVFLDEIGAMPLSAQVKLLDVLEDRMFYRVGGTKKVEVSSRIISATNIDLEEAVKKNLFRKDLFFRLNVVKIEMPPLRERPDDIIPLTKYFMDYYNCKFDKRFHKISAKAKKNMLKYHWPGNIRELRNTIERIILLEEGDTLLPEHLSINFNQSKQEESGRKPDFSGDHAGGSLDYEEITKNLIKEALKRTDGNVSESAQLLNMPVHKLRYRIKKFRLKN